MKFSFFCNGFSVVAKKWTKATVLGEKAKSNFGSQESKLWCSPPEILGKGRAARPAESAHLCAIQGAVILLGLPRLSIEEVGPITLRFRMVTIWHIEVATVFFVWLQFVLYFILITYR